jgi:hypothetical protein
LFSFTLIAQAPFSRLRFHAVNGLLVALFGIFLLLPVVVRAQAPPPSSGGDKPTIQSETIPADPPPGEAQAPPSSASQRVELNLLGVADTASGESRRNENVQFNLVDNNALKELNIRLGVNATVLTEFQPERGYFGAEFGNPPTSVVHSPILPIDNWHGRIHYSHLNSATTARAFFQVGAVRPAREHDYGFATNFRIRRKTFFSIDGTQQRLTGNVNGNVLVPRLDERTPLTNDPALGTLIQRFLNAYPTELPNRTDINERALNTNAPQIINNNSAGLRLQHEVSESDSLNLLYQFTSQSVDAFQLVAGQNPDTDTKSHRARVTWVRSISPNTLLELSSGFDRIGSLLVPERNAVGPMVSIAGLTTLGPVGGITIDRAENLFRQAAQGKHTHGNHNITFGFQGTRRQFNGVMEDVHRGFFGFTPDFGNTAFDNLRLGLPQQHLVSIGDPNRGYRNTELLFYAGDEWRVRPDLTLSMGVRYEPVGRPYEVNRLEEIEYGADLNNVGGNFGVAWQMPRNLGVLRASAGVFFGQIFPVTYQQVRFTPPNNYKIVLPAPDLLDPLAAVDFDNLQDTIPTTYHLDSELATPYSYMANLAWEHSVGRFGRVQLGYVGSRSHKLLIMWYENRARPVPGIPQTTQTWNDRRPDTTVADRRRVLNGSRGFYDAARVSFLVNEWHGLTLDTSYWWSKAIDLGSSYSNTAFDGDSRVSRSQSEFNTHPDMRGPSDFHQPHAFLNRLSYRLPSTSRGWAGALTRNWDLTGIFLYKTGTPFTVQSGSDAPGFGNVDGNGQDRPNLLDPSILGRRLNHPDTSQALLPASAFEFIQPTDDRGNLGRNTFHKGRIRNLNASLSRRWVFASERTFLLRAESVNFTNTPQFAEPGFELSNPNFGVITNTLNDGRTFLLRAEIGW